MAKRKVFQIGNALSEGLVETMHAAHNYAGDLRIEIISLNKLEVDPDNPRCLLLEIDDLRFGLDKKDENYLQKLKEKESLESLAKSIASQGIINPIVVYKLNDKYKIIAGERRTLASILCGKQDIPAKILDKKPSELKLSLLQWIENIERQDLSLWERFRNLEKIMAFYLNENGKDLIQVNATELSKLLGCSLPHAMNYKALLQADEELKKLIADNAIRNIEKAALIATVKVPSLREKLIKVVLEGANLKELKNILNSEKLLQKIKLKASSAKESRGRHPHCIHLGTTKNIEVAKLIFQSILKNERLKQLNEQFQEIDFQNYQTINKNFKQLLKSLEILTTTNSLG